VWTLPRFFLALGIPGILYFIAATLIPEDPDEVASWRDHYYETRVQLFGGITAWAVIAAADATVNLGTPLDHPGRIVQAITAVLGIVGLGSSSPRVHSALAVSAVVVVLLFAFLVSSEAGWLAG